MIKISNITLPPYGALDYYQIHYIVDVAPSNPSEYMARCRAIKSGIVKKKIIGLLWEGGRLAAKLTADKELEKLAIEILEKERDIKVDALDDCIRIYSGWRHREDLHIDMRFFMVADIIASHIKYMNRSK